MLTLDLVIEEVGHPRAWVGHGVELAERLVRRRVVEGLPRKGLYLGPIAPGSTVRPDGYARHGWVETYDGRLCDPLRWTFENSAPYLFLGRDDQGFYDVDGEMTRARFATHPPDFEKKALRLPACPCYSCDVFVRSKVLGGSPAVTVRQARYIATMDPSRLGCWARHVYQWLVMAGCGDLIPWKQRVRIIGPLPASASVPIE